MERTFKIRCSAIHEIMAGEIGLTEIQENRLKELSERNSGIGKPLTDNMKKELSTLINKKNNPELPQGAKTHCKKWLKEFKYKRRKKIKSKYIEKGNTCEEDGFTIMALQLDLGMVRKNTERRSNEYIIGSCDLHKEDIRTVYDNKCSWDLDTFPMFESEIPDQKYIDQLQGYGDLWNAEKLCLCYTLIDAPKELIESELRWIKNSEEAYEKICEMVYTKSYFDELVKEFCPLAKSNYFIEIPEKDRIKYFYFEFDKSFIEKVNERVIMCRKYINTLIK